MVVAMPWGAARRWALAEIPDTRDPRLLAGYDLLRRCGAIRVQLRYDDDPEPTVWVCDAAGPWSPEGEEAEECAAALDPVNAVLRLCDQLVDGATCNHCKRPSGVTEYWREEMPLATMFCWYVFDPETQKFRRSCEGETVGRNDPCPCGSGLKFKKCCGVGAL